MRRPEFVDEIRPNSLSRDMLTVVDESVKVRVREPDGDTERKRQRLGRFRPLA